MKRFAGHLSLVVFCLLCMPLGAAAAEHNVVEIPVSVMVDGSEPDWNAVYTLELAAQSPDCPMPEGSRNGIYRLAVKGGSTGILWLPGGEPGIYEYVLRQISGKEGDCRYDEQEYRIQLLVTEEEISAEAYKPDGTKVTDILFRNRWAEPVWVTLSAWVTLDGSPPEDGVLSCLLLSEEGEELYRVKNQGRHAVFPPLHFDREGVCRYEMKEVAVAGDGIVYDRAVYTIFVTVRKEADYQAEVSILRNGKPYSGTPLFANESEEGIPKTGDKIGLWLLILVFSGGLLMAMIGAGKSVRHGEINVLEEISGM